MTSVGLLMFLMTLATVNVFQAGDASNVWFFCAGQDSGGQFFNRCGWSPAGA